MQNTQTTQYTQNHTIIRPVFLKIKNDFQKRYSNIVIKDILINEGQFLTGKTPIFEIEYDYGYFEKSDFIDDKIFLINSIGLIKEILVKPGDKIDINTPLFMIEHYCYNREFYNDYNFSSINIIRKQDLFNDEF